MKIRTETKENKSVRFDSLSGGDCFEWKDEFYMKCHRGMNGYNNSVCLTSGAFDYFKESEIVERLPNAEFFPYGSEK